MFVCIYFCAYMIINLHVYYIFLFTDAPCKKAVVISMNDMKMHVYTHVYIRILRSIRIHLYEYIYALIYVRMQIYIYIYTHLFIDAPCKKAVIISINDIKMRVYIHVYIHTSKYTYSLA
jgi:hypothetical protein